MALDSATPSVLQAFAVGERLTQFTSDFFENFEGGILGAALSEFDTLPDIDIDALLNRIPTFGPVPGSLLFDDGTTQMILQGSGLFGPIDDVLINTLSFLQGGQTVLSITLQASQVRGSATCHPR